MSTFNAKLRNTEGCECRSAGPTNRFTGISPPDSVEIAGEIAQGHDEQGEIGDAQGEIEDETLDETIKAGTPFSLLGFLGFKA